MDVICYMFRRVSFEMKDTCIKIIHWGTSLVNHSIIFVLSSLKLYPIPSLLPTIFCSSVSTSYWDVLWRWPSHVPSMFDSCHSFAGPHASWWTQGMCCLHVSQTSHCLCSMWPVCLGIFYLIRIMSGSHHWKQTPANRDIPSFISLCFKSPLILKAWGVTWKSDLFAKLCDLQQIFFGAQKRLIPLLPQWICIFCANTFAIT